MDAKTEQENKMVSDLIDEINRRVKNSTCESGNEKYQELIKVREELITLISNVFDDVEKKIDNE